jgi:hypothetical protein
MTATTFPPPEREGAPPGSSREGSVVLDIGGDVGALVLHMPAALSGREIHVRPLDDGGRTIHTEVRARHVAGGTLFAAVFASLPAGVWELVPVEPGTCRRVTVVGGEVTEATW